MKCENTMGRRISFWQMLGDKRIKIPTIQRDYTYGACTAKTDAVLDHLLNDLYEALFGPSERHLTLDFIYGTGDPAGNFMPLDGQQRLTTLFLLHYYAATAISSTNEDIQRLRNFSYATRECSKEFCEHILDALADMSSLDGTFPSEVIRDQAFFLPSFEDDPTVRSMLVVLDRIHGKFQKKRFGLWSELVRPDCHIDFDELDFGPYGLSDDLYVKMNARGKPLTEFEIFKSRFEQYIDQFYSKTDDTDLNRRREISRKIDTDWSDLIWGERGRDETKIDASYVNLFKNIFWLMLCRGSQGTENLDETKVTADISVIRTRQDMDFIEDFFDVFAHEMPQGTLEDLWHTVFYVDKDAVNGSEEKRHLIRVFGHNDESVFLSALKGELDWGDIVRLYGFYLWIKSGKRQSDPLRHLRNLVENSPDELRFTHMGGLLADTESLFDGTFVMHESTSFNRTQWREEIIKDSLHEKWKCLFAFENSALLRGALSIFAQNEFAIGNDEVYLQMTTALRGMNRVFCSREDHSIRRLLLSYGDFSQSPVNHADKIMLGCRFEHWREMLVKSGRRIHQERIVSLLQKIGGAQIPVDELPFTDVKCWRYYLIHYSEDSYFTNSGYYFLPEQEKDTGLEIVSMNSSVHSEYNLEWRLLNVILLREARKIITNDGAIPLSIDPHGAKPLAIGNKVKMTIRQSGWKIVEGLDMVRKALDGSGVELEGDVCRHPQGEDVVQYGLKIVQTILAYIDTPKEDGESESLVHDAAVE